MLRKKYENQENFEGKLKDFYGIHFKLFNFPFFLIKDSFCDFLIEFLLFKKQFFNFEIFPTSNSIEDSKRNFSWEKFSWFVAWWMLTSGFYYNVPLLFSSGDFSILYQRLTISQLPRRAVFFEENWIEKVLNWRIKRKAIKWEEIKEFLRERINWFLKIW